MSYTRLKSGDLPRAPPKGTASRGAKGKNPVMALAVLFAVFLAGTAAWRLIADPIHRGVIERLAVSPGMSVVDIGCGSGSLTVRIDRAVGLAGEVAGIDISLK